jgi:subtilisin family serine protease
MVGQFDRKEEFAEVALDSAYACPRHNGEVGAAARSDGRRPAMTSALELAGLASLMERTRGSAAVRIGLVDGPVAVDHPDLDGPIRSLDGPAGCALPDSAACRHGTFVAGILSARRVAPAPAICPDCTLLVRSIFAEDPSGALPTTSLPELAAAIGDAVDAGARVINLSSAAPYSSEPADRTVRAALDRAAARGVIVVAAAGNQAQLGSTHVTRHRCVVPVVAGDAQGRPLDMTNLGRTISLRGVLAPGRGVVSLAASGGSTVIEGTSVAAPFVTGAIALLWSVFADARASDVIRAVLGPPERRRRLVPPALDAGAAYRALAGLDREWRAAG